MIVLNIKVLHLTIELVTIINYQMIQNNMYNPSVLNCMDKN